MESSRRAEAFDRRINDFVLKMKRQQIDGTLLAAKRTLELMRELLGIHKHEDHVALIEHVREVGLRMISARPQDLVVGNMVRRVLHLIREVAGEQGAPPATSHPAAAAASPTSVPTMHRHASLATLMGPPERPRGQLASFYGSVQPNAPLPVVAQHGYAPSEGVDVLPEVAEGASPRGDSVAGGEGGAGTDGGRAKRKGKQWAGNRQVLELLTELIDEMDLAEDAIVAKATTHIHANEVILTFGLSQTTLKFLLKAAERRTFQVVVAEGAPKLAGLTMARHLTDAGIPTLVIPDACTFALMARVNKVLVGAQAVLATGGVVCQAGSRLVALAARHHRVPFVVVTGLYKLSPLFPHDPSVMRSKFDSPSTFAPRALQSSTLRVGEGGAYQEGCLHLPCPAVDYIDPEYIDLLITDTGGYTPSYIYRLLQEYYSREDYALSKELLDRMGRQ